MKIFRKIKNYFTIPYVRTLQVTLDNGTKLYCSRQAHADFKNNKNDDWMSPRGRGGHFFLNEGIWNEYPDDTCGFIPYEKIKSFKVLTSKEDFEEYKKYQLEYFKKYPVEMYEPERRSDLTKEFLEWLNQPRVQLMIRNWVDGYGYSDAYNWESPDILMEHIYKEVAIKYGGEEVLKKMRSPGEFAL